MVRAVFCFHQVIKEIRRSNPQFFLRVCWFSILLLWVSLSSFGQPPRPYGPVPSAGQLQWHETGMYCIIHFGPDTYTDKEWGYGDEDPVEFNPTAFNAMQIVGAAKSAGFRGIVVVAKHHDGFCLWPTKTTTHNISRSPYKNGKGDILQEYREACDKLHMKMGVYCSPWDRNSSYYGSRRYVELYREQLKELYTHYGPLFMSWHDGANGGDGYYGGARERRMIDRTTYYGWDTTWALVRKYQPTAAIFGDVGPDVRWVGNEQGFAGETCWATYSPHAPDEGKLPANGYCKYWEGTTGHRDGKYWMPAECDVPLRPGWFYHATDDDKVKTPYMLFDLYFRSVGKGAALDLGLAPDRRGILHETDVKTLREFGELIRSTFRTNLLKQAVIIASDVRQDNNRLYGPSLLTDGNVYSYWATDDEVKQATLTIDFKRPQRFNIISIRENIKLGQRVDSVTVYLQSGSTWQKIGGATSIGSLRLIRLPQYVTARRVKIEISKASACPALSELGVYAEPLHLSAPQITRNKKGEVSISTEGAVASIRYTLNGREPTVSSSLYEGPFMLTEGGTVRAKAFNDTQSGEEVVKKFGLSKERWKVLQPEGSALSALIDDNENTIAAIPELSEPASQDHPALIVVDMGKIHRISAFTFLPPAGPGRDGIADQYRFWVSLDGEHWNRVAEGEFSNIAANRIEQMVNLGTVVLCRYFKLEILNLLSGKQARIAELGAIAEKD